MCSYRGVLPIPRGESVITQASCVNAHQILRFGSNGEPRDTAAGEPPQRRRKSLPIPCEEPDLEQAAGVLLAQVNVDHLEQPLDLVVAHLAVLVLVGPLQVAPDPGFRGSRNKFQA